MSHAVAEQSKFHLVLEPDFAATAGDLVWVTTHLENHTRAGVVLADGRVWVPQGFEHENEPLIATGVLKRWIDTKPPDFRLMVDASFFVGSESGILYVEAVGTPNHRGGQLHWSLVHSPLSGGTSTVLAVGDDRKTPKKVEARFPGAFPAGIYTLNATLYNGDGTVLAKTSRFWILNTVGYGLVSGRVMDQQPPLFYSEFI